MKINTTKNLVKKLLRESLFGEEVIKTSTIIAYHGSPTEIPNFVDEFVGGENAKDQEGPGIYFTTDYNEAYGYADKGFIYKVNLHPRLLYGQDESKITIKPQTIEKLAKMAPDWQTHAGNFDENPNIGLRTFVQSTANYNDSDKDVLQQIWIDFYHYNPVDFVRNCVKLGIDGIMITRHSGDGQHIIIYNPNVIEVVEKIKI